MLCTAALKTLFHIAVLILTFSSCMAQQGRDKKTVITADISNFWTAYDQVIQTKDSLKQIELITSLYINRGSSGLRALMQARRYTPASYVYAINHYPEFWNSVRANTLKADSYAAEIEQGIERLKALYPPLHPASIYFSIGVLRTGGTTLDGKVLIGSEISMADRTTVTHELEKEYPHLPVHFKTDPVHHLVFLNTHEYIHTQQKTSMGNNLLAQAVIEGVAEFIAEKALNIPSPNPVIGYGKEHNAQIRTAFSKEMFSPYIYNWIWNNTDNEFRMRDLAYYVGYAICENYYGLSQDKNQAIKNMIELDYNNEAALMSFVEASHYFEKPLEVYRAEFETARPKVIRVEPFENVTYAVDPHIQRITLHFSQPMNVHASGFDLGPLGEKHVLRAQNSLGFSEDGRSYTYEVRLETRKHYQVVVSERFRDENDLPLKPYLIDITTAGVR